jgi:collagenase-like PrtC family protease
MKPTEPDNAPDPDVGQAHSPIRFAVGYQLAEGDEEPFVEIVRDYRDRIAEVYFPWEAMPSGRAALSERRGYVDWSARERLEAELVEIKRMGVKLDLLFNAACYGRDAVSEYLRNQVASVLDRLEQVAGGVDIVTTTSPAVARTVGEHSPGVEVRASVNMKIGTVQGMSYVADLFDSFHVQREHNRDLGHLARLKRWAEAHGKRLVMLANSGCLADCSGQAFHDNLVAHEREIDETVNIPGFTPMVCWAYLRDPANWRAILQATWIRPEDLPRYAGLFEVVKLATRMHVRPRMVIDAYARGRYGGNLLDLFEPGHGPALAPNVIDNGAFPDDWFDRVTSCGRVCERCDHCARVLRRVLRSGDSSPTS